MTDSADVRLDVHTIGNTLRVNIHAGRYQEFGAQLAL